MKQWAIINFSIEPLSLLANDDVMVMFFFPKSWSEVSPLTYKDGEPFGETYIKICLQTAMGIGNQNCLSEGQHLLLMGVIINNQYLIPVII